jgi:DNA-binding transcriptional LysR family regulator
MRISMPFGLGNTWVSQALARFALQYPEVKLTIHVTNRWVDVSEEPYDVVIHIGKVLNENLPVRRLAELPRGLYASPAYCERKGIPQRSADLRNHDCIALESQLNDGVWTFQDPEAGRVTVTPRLITTDIIVAREMAMAGIGIAILTHAVSEKDVQAGRLIRVLPQWDVPPVIIAAMFLERRHMPLRTRAFIDLIAQAIQANPALVNARPR